MGAPVAPINYYYGYYSIWYIINCIITVQLLYIAEVLLKGY